MDYMQLRARLGIELAAPLEDAVLTALKQTKGDSEAHDALRAVMVALLGAVIWPKIKPGEGGALEKQCSQELARAICEIGKHTPRSGRQVN